MSPTDVEPSARLRRAAEAERQDIERHRQRLCAVRQQLVEKLAAVDGALATLDERSLLLSRLAPEHAHAPTPTGASRPPVEPPAADEPERGVLRGPAIREVAVSLAAAQPAVEALHYRDWFELLTSAGWQVAGKDPLAVFLTQLSRSPVVRKATQSGIYAIDRQAPHRLRDQLVGLEAQLRDLAVGVPAGTDLGVLRARRESLLTSIRHTERALDESKRVLDINPPLAEASSR